MQEAQKNQETCILQSIFLQNEIIEKLNERINRLEAILESQEELRNNVIPQLENKLRRLGMAQSIFNAYIASFPKICPSYNFVQSFVDKLFKDNNAQLLINMPIKCAVMGTSLNRVHRELPKPFVMFWKFKEEPWYLVVNEDSMVLSDGYAYQGTFASRSEPKSEQTAALSEPKDTTEAVDEPDHLIWSFGKRVGDTDTQCQLMMAHSGGGGKGFFKCSLQDNDFLKKRVDYSEYTKVYPFFVLCKREY